MKTAFQHEQYKYEPQSVSECTQVNGRICLMRVWHRFEEGKEYTFAFFPIRATRKQIIAWRSFSFTQG